MADLDERLVTRRPFVPSHREVDLGLADYEFVPLPPPEAAERRHPVQALREGVAGLDPRTLGGPLLPLVLFGTALVLAELDTNAFNVLSPNIRSTFNSSTGFIAALSTILLVVTTVLSPLAGYLADRVNRIRLLAIGSSISSLAQIVAGRAPSITVIAGSRAVSGVGASLAQPVVLPVLMDFYPVKSRARAMGLLFVFLGLGSTLGPVVSGYLGRGLGWRSTFVGLGVLSVMAALALLFLKEPPRGVQERLAEGATEEVAHEEQKPLGWSEGWRAAASISSLRRIWYMTPFLVAAGSFLVPIYSLYYANEFGVSSTGRGWILGVDGAFGLVGLSMASTVADRILAVRPGRVFTLAGGLLAFNAVVMVVLAASPSLWLSILVLLPTQAAGFLIGPALLSVVSLVVPPRLRGFGLQTTAPWSLLGFFVIEAIFLGAPGLGIRGTLLIVGVLFAVGSVVVGTGAPGVERDMRAARAASLADEIARKARASGGNKILICTDVDVTYDSSQVLFNVDFEMEEGELVALLGTNGAGKSTLQRAIAGIQEASNGAIFFDGDDITHRPAHLNAAAGIVFMPGGAAVFPGLTVRENLRAAGWLHRYEGGASQEQLDEVLELFPVLADRMDVPAGNLSGGEQQMVALSQAFLMKPRLLMIDELSLGLAPAVVEQLLEIVRRINANGTTVLLVEQSANVALTLARRAVFMDKGEIRFDGPTEELLGRSDLLRAVFLGGTGAGATGYVASGRPAAATEETGPVLVVDDVHVSYGGRAALSGVSLTVDPGQVVGVIGPNGAGKTTLFDVISGYTRPESGAVSIAGADCARLGPDARARIGLARSFQNARLFPALTVRENIAVALERRLATRSAVAAALWLPTVSRSERRVRRRVDYLVDLMHLEAYADKFVRELSTGSRRMVDIACIMAAEPRLLLLDEPSSGLAQSEVELLGPVVRRLAKETGCGVLCIEHDIPLITALSDHLHVLALGRNLAQGTPAEVVADPEVVAAYLGANEATIQRSGSLLPSAMAAAAVLAAPTTPSSSPERTLS